MLFPIDAIAAIMFLSDACQTYLKRRGALPDPAATMMLVLAYIGVTYISAWIADQAARRYIRRRGGGGVLCRNVAIGVTTGARAFVVGLYVLLLHTSGWPFGPLRALGVRDTDLMTQSLVGIVPYVLLCLASWIPLFRLHAMTTPGDWTLPGYLLYRIRYTLFVFGLWIPFMLLFGLMDGVERFEWLGILVETPLGLYALLFLAAWAFPFFLRFFWGCSRLPAGALRTRILELQERTGIRFSEVLVWDFGGGALLNAAAVGLFHPFRYLFLSRALVASLPPQELDAVVCHEMGHVRHRHLLFYVLLTFAVMRIAQGGIELTTSESVSVFAMILIMVLYFRFVFGFLSRRMERQADLFALETQGTATPLCEALERLGILSGNIRMASSWHHLSIAERVAFLRAVEQQPRLAHAHHLHVQQVKATGYVFVASIFALYLLPGALLMPWRHGGSPPELGRERLVAHWQRVRRLVPDEPTGPLQLGDLLLGHEPSDGTRQLAASLAREALARSHTVSQRRRALALLHQADPTSRPASSTP